MGNFLPIIRVNVNDLCSDDIYFCDLSLLIVI